MMKPTVNNQRLILRADGGASIGTGHVMRCLALAQGWQDCGGEVVFVGRVGNALRQKIEANGCAFVDVKQPFPAPGDFEILSKLVQKDVQTTCPWVIVDGYHFTNDYTWRLRQAGAKVLLFDDYAHQAEYSVDLLLNQNLGSEGLVYKVNSDAVMLLGSRYAILRREFLRGSKKEINTLFPEEVRHLLVTLGGADPENVTFTVIEALSLLELPQLQVKVIVGPSNQYFDLLKSRMVEASFDGELLTAVEDMVPLMKWADLAISAGGSTCWELLCLGVPFGVLILADNQQRVATMLAENKVASNWGWYNTITEAQLAHKIGTLLNDSGTRGMYSCNGRKLIDGNGVFRIIHKMVPQEIFFRKAGMNDCELIYEWANDPEARQNSFSIDQIVWDEHKDWFAKKIKDSNWLMFVANAKDGQNVGLVRFEKKQDSVVISVNIAPEMRGYGLGGRVIDAACKKVFDECQCTCIDAYIKDNNLASQRAFKNAGFVKVSKQVFQGAKAVHLRRRVGGNK